MTQTLTAVGTQSKGHRNVKILRLDSGHPELQNGQNFTKIGSQEPEIALRVEKFYCATS